jgi:hypothetical protein
MSIHPFEPLRRKAIFVRPDPVPRAPTLEDIQRSVASAKRDASDAEATRAAASARTARAAADEIERRNALMASLAAYFGATSAEYLADALDAHAPTISIARPIFEQLRRVEPHIVVEALHCIAGSLPFGAPRAADKVIGTNAAKAVRTLPASLAIELPPRPQRPGWFSDWAMSAGISMPSHPGVDFETPAQWTRRIDAQRARGLYSADSAENTRLAAQEAELMRKKRFDLEEKADAEHHAAIEAVRLRVVSVVDDVLAAMPFGLAYWYAREFRRAVANERLTMPPHPSVPGVTFTAWRMTQVLGVRFDFGKVSS